jgi:hypothetical protein
MILDFVDGFAGSGKGTAELEEELLQRHVVDNKRWWVIFGSFSH